LVLLCGEYFCRSKSLINLADGKSCYKNVYHKEDSKMLTCFSKKFKSHSNHENWYIFWIEWQLFFSVTLMPTLPFIQSHLSVLNNVLVIFPWLPSLCYLWSSPASAHWTARWQSHSFSSPWLMSRICQITHNRKSMQPTCFSL
jgi:hypothetical protein